MPNLNLLTLPAALLLFVSVPQVLRDLTTETEMVCDLGLHQSAGPQFVSTWCSAADRLHLLNASTTLGYNIEPSFNKARYLSGVVAVQAFVMAALGKFLLSNKVITHKRIEIS